MTIEYGLMLGGTVVPNTEHIIRDPSAWWGPNDPATRPRPTGVLPTILLGHWTAGEAGARRDDDDGPFIYNVMRNRPSKDPVLASQGVKMKVSIHFVIGAGGDVWQTADPLTTVAFHVGMGSVNTRSIGVEIVNPGTGPMVPNRPRVVLRNRMLPTAKQPLGRLVKQLAYYPNQIDSWVELAELLAKHLPIPRQVPRAANGGLEIGRFTVQEQARWKGAQEHFHVPTTTKVDAGTQLIRALEDAGWPAVTP